MAVQPAATLLTPAQNAAVAAGMSVAEQSSQVKEMSKDWAIIEALRGGTRAMREKGEVYLPREPRETTGDYQLRAKVATLFPAMERTISVMAGKPFSKALTLTEVSGAIEKLWENIDNQGQNAHAFFFTVFDETFYGVAGVLVDRPVAVAPEKAANAPTDAAEPVLTQADIQAQKIRTYARLYRHNSIVGWREQITDDGRRILTQLRLREEVEVEDGEYGTKTVVQIRVLTPGSWEVHRQNDGEHGGFTRHDGGQTGLDVIPFRMFYGKRKDFMIGVSPLMELAHQNVKHYQIQSDQDDSARFCRKRLVVFNLKDKKTVTDIESSSSAAITLGLDEKVEIVQGSAESVEVGRKELNDLEEQMVRTGAELIVMKPGGQRTATQDNNEGEGNKSDLQRMAEAFEDGIDEVLGFFALFENADPDSAGHAELFKDFGVATLGEASAQMVLSMQTSGLLSKETAIKEMQRRGVVSADVDPEDELKKVEQEGPPPGTMGLDPVTGLPIPMPEPALDADGNPIEDDPNDPTTKGKPGKGPKPAFGRPPVVKPPTK